MERIPAMMAQLENLSGAVERLEGLITREISDLKSEQIADLKRQNERLSDDQRRAWEAIRSIENDRNRMNGAGRVIHAILLAVGALVGASVSAIVARIIR